MNECPDHRLSAPQSVLYSTKGAINLKKCEHMGYYKMAFIIRFRYYVYVNAWVRASRPIKRPIKSWIKP